MRRCGTVVFREGVLELLVISELDEVVRKVVAQVQSVLGHLFVHRGHVGQERIHCRDDVALTQAVHLVAHVVIARVLEALQVTRRHPNPVTLQLLWIRLLHLALGECRRYCIFHAAVLVLLRRLVVLGRVSSWRRLVFLIVAHGYLIDGRPEELAGVKFIFGAVNFVVCLPDVLEYLEVVKDCVVVILQIVFDALSDREIQTFVICQSLAEHGPAGHRDLVLLHVLLGALALKAATKL